MIFNEKTEGESRSLWSIYENKVTLISQKCVAHKKKNKSQEQFAYKSVIEKIMEV